MKTLRNAAILTALGAAATAIVIMPLNSNEATTVPGVVVTPQTTSSASPGEATTDSAADLTKQAPASAPAAPPPADRPAPAAPSFAPAPSAELPVAPAPPLAPEPVPQVPALSGVCEWDNEEWECDDDWDDG